MKNIVYIATSIDGYIARKDGSLDWLMEVPNPDNDDYGFADFIDSVDGIIMGRNTFEMVASFGQWPYTKPVYVFSSTLKAVPAGYEDKASIVKGEPKAIVESLNNEGIINIYVDGGKTIQAFLEQDLVDELIITRIPIVLGSGIPLFSESTNELKLEHVSTNVLNKALVQSHYRRKY